MRRGQHRDRLLLPRPVHRRGPGRKHLIPRMTVSLGRRDGGAQWAGTDKIISHPRRRGGPRSPHQRGLCGPSTKNGHCTTTPDVLAVINSIAFSRRLRDQAVLIIAAVPVGIEQRNPWRPRSATAA